MDLVEQQYLGNYRLVRLLGEGGYAQVYLGEHVLLTRPAAIKWLHARFSPSDITRFFHEAKAISHLEHPHIVRVFECDVAEGRPFLVMEYAPGGSLRERHPDGIPLALPMIERYVQQLSQALQYAHDQHLIHRDVKPENVLIGTLGQLLLADFGFALLTQRSSHLHLQDVGGTVAYMAPEQLQGHPRRASDQYALGVMVYEWLTGKPLFAGSVAEIITQHLHATPRSPCELLPSIPKPVEQVVLRALAKDPKSRFASVAAFADAFVQACQSTGVPPLTPYPLPARLAVTRPVPARQAPLPPAELSQAGDPPQPAPAPPRSAAHLKPTAWARRLAFRWRRFHLVPLPVGLVVLLLLALVGGLVWQTSHFRQTIITGKYVTSLGVGVGADPVTQAVQGESDTFKAGTTVVLVVTIVGWNGYAEARLLLGTTLVDTQQWQASDVFSTPPAPQSHFTASVKLDQAGDYRWEIDLTSFAGGSVPFADGSITFQVT